jgi:hypothetical protein
VPGGVARGATGAIVPRVAMAPGWNRRYDAGMTRLDDARSDLRADLIESLRACRASERDVFSALDAAERDRPGPDGGWSAKDELAHLSAWRQRQANVMAAHRERRAQPPLPAADIDETNAVFHAARADWAWDRVEADADATADALVAEVSAADDEALADPQILGSIMGDGPEHDLAHLARIGAAVGLEPRVLELADLTRAMIDGGGWPSRSAAYARYNLACFHALGGRLEAARALLRLALPQEEELRTLAPGDDDLVALRGEIPSLSGT